MKELKATFVLGAGLVAILISSCAGPADLSSKSSNTTEDIVTAGLRSGDQAINRNNIDALLNNPDSNRSKIPWNETVGESGSGQFPPNGIKPERPGLATGWGSEKKSRMTYTAFTRSSVKPAGTDVVFYNGMDGINAMTKNKEKVGAMQPAAGDLVEWGIKGGFGFLDTYKENGFGRRLVAGKEGSSYSIVVKNRCKSDLEIVASVDGLDVQDGKTASFSKRGYIVAAGKTFVIEGFRTSASTVAAFKFSSVSNSYANLRHGNTRNVGVIGIAVFTRKGVNPWTWMPGEVKQRDTANPFATAP